MGPAGGDVCRTIYESRLFSVRIHFFGLDYLG